MEITAEMWAELLARVDAYHVPGWQTAKAMNALMKASRGDDWLSSDTVVVLDNAQGHAALGKRDFVAVPPHDHKDPEKWVSTVGKQLNRLGFSVREQRTRQHHDDGGWSDECSIVVDWGYVE